MKKKLSPLPPYTYQDEFIDENTRKKFMKYRETMIRRKRGEIPPKRKEDNGATHHKRNIGKCTICGTTSPRTEALIGKKWQMICAKCYLEII